MFNPVVCTNPDCQHNAGYVEPVIQKNIENDEEAICPACGWDTLPYHDSTES